MLKRGLLALLLLVSSAAQTQDTIIQFHPDLEKILDPKAPIIQLSSGHQWLEGPAWDRKRGRLYFSDVPVNKAYVWQQGPKGSEVKDFLDPSGLAQNLVDGSNSPGSNGLLYSKGDMLYIANHGKRAVEVMEIDSKKRIPIIAKYKGKKFNSPNDLAMSKTKGTLFFTDPPYGLTGLNASPLKQLPFNGVYSMTPSGELTLIDKDLSFPNGIALSPDEGRLYVAVSDPKKPELYQYTRRPDGSYGDRTLLFDAKKYLDKGYSGLPDGMVVSTSGHIFLTGPGGVFILAADGTLLGLIKLTTKVANCTFGEDGSTLFMTAQNRLLKIQTNVKGW